MRDYGHHNPVAEGATSSHSVEIEEHDDHHGKEVIKS
jgi:hypothetical protein